MTAELRRHRLQAVVVVAVVAGLLAAGCRPRAPRIDFANRRYSGALRTAANTRSVERLRRARELIDRDHARGLIGVEEHAAYAAIVALAEAGKWQEAERRATRFRSDQRPRW